MAYTESLTYNSGDRPLSEALTLMNDEGLTSIAVVDNAMNVVGNISTADIKLLTKTSSFPLLASSCIHFISVILTERGTIDGKDSFPGGFPTFSISITHILTSNSIPRLASIYIVSHGCETRGHESSPDVGRRIPIPVSLHSRNTSSDTLPVSRCIIVAAWLNSCFTSPQYVPGSLGSRSPRSTTFRTSHWSYLAN